MPLPGWNLDTTINEKLDHLRAGIEELLGDRWTQAYPEPPMPDNVPQNQVLSGFTADQIATLRAVLGIDPQQTAQAQGNPPGQAQAEPRPAGEPAPVQPAPPFPGQPAPPEPEPAGPGPRQATDGGPVTPPAPPMPPGKEGSNATT